MRVRIWNKNKGCKNTVSKNLPNEYIIHFDYWGPKKA